MNSITSNQIASVLKILAPVLVGLFVKWGLPAEVAGPFVDWSAAIATGLIASAIAWVANREANVVKRAASTDGVKITVDSNASPEVKAVAKDSEVPNVV